MLLDQAEECICCWIRQRSAYAAGSGRGVHAAGSGRGVHAACLKHLLRLDLPMKSIHMRSFSPSCRGSPRGTGCWQSRGGTARRVRKDCVACPADRQHKGWCKLCLETMVCALICRCGKEPQHPPRTSIACSMQSLPCKTCLCLFMPYLQKDKEHRIQLSKTSSTAHSL